ncbi:thiocillin family RiPP [Rummeliibacillus sp. SL167]|uniref:thiocillin family RiPP n=1 Tax=Rummeliibacillus sp. SL167 TaxID=2579792 RepID=UPI0011B7A13D|nr:thiocillin family RiPP [Rummeliibacillus sp. SL167]
MKEKLNEEIMTTLYIEEQIDISEFAGFTTAGSAATTSSFSSGGTCAATVSTSSSFSSAGD